MSKKTYIRLAVVACAIILLFFFHGTLLTGAGGYLAPAGSGNADVVIVEGTYYIEQGALERAKKLLSSGSANGLVVVVHQPSDEEKAFGVHDYRLLLRKELAALGLRKKSLILVAPSVHPITLSEAQMVLPDLARRNVRSAILMVSDFHTRRSYWAYKEAGAPLGIKVIPHSYFISYEREAWWKSLDGVSDFCEELTKFVYYVIRGYIPIKSLFVV